MKTILRTAVLACLLGSPLAFAQQTQAPPVTDDPPPAEPVEAVDLAEPATPMEPTKPVEPAADRMDPPAPPPVDAQAPAEATAPAMSAEHQAMMQAWLKAATPGPQHQQLIDQMVGTWDTTTTMWMDPDAPPIQQSGRMVNTAVLDGHYVRMDFTGEFMGQTFQGVGRTGYDNIAGEYVSSWVDSMSTGIYTATGDYDPASKTYTYHGMMPNPMQPDAPIPVRQVVRIDDDDHHVMEWYETRDGEEIKTMQIEFVRAE